MTTATSFDWRPRVEMITRAHRTAPILDRMSVLAHLPWQTPDEALELELLIEWLKLDGDQCLMATEALTRSCARLDLDLLGDDDLLRPATMLADMAWSRLTDLANGFTIEPRRADVSSEAEAWFKRALHIMSHMDYHDELSQSRMLELFGQSELYAIVRYDIAKLLFGDPGAVGACLYLEPAPGVGFGSGQILETIDALTTAASDAQRSLEESSGDERVTLGNRLIFFTWLLKGYLWAGTHLRGDTLMAQCLAHNTKQWNTTRTTLLAAVTILRTDEAFFVSLGWTPRKTDYSRMVNATPAHEVVRAMESRMRRAISAE